MPGARESQTLVVEKCRVLGVLPLAASVVSQAGRLLVTTLKKGAGETLEDTAMGMVVGVPVPFT